MKSRINGVGKVLGGMKKVFSCRVMVYERVAVPTPLYWAETWSMTVAEKKRLNVMEMRCQRSMCGVTRMDQVRNEV